MIDLDVARAGYKELCDWLDDKETSFSEKPPWSKDDAHELCEALGFTSLYLGGANHAFVPPYTPEQRAAVDSRWSGVNIPPEYPLGSWALSQLRRVIEEWVRVTNTPL